MFSQPFCKCFAPLLHVFFLKIHPAILISINHPTFLEESVSVLKVYQDVLDHAASSEMYFNTMFSADTITIIIRKLELDHGLQFRTSMTVEDIISLLEFCLKTTYFQFQGRFFEQL